MVAWLCEGQQYRSVLDYHNCLLILINTETQQAGIVGLLSPTYTSLYWLTGYQHSSNAQISNSEQGKDLQKPLYHSGISFICWSVKDTGISIVYSEFFR